MDYYNKYLKYKNKYIGLKNQLGGYNQLGGTDTFVANSAKDKYNNYVLQCPECNAVSGTYFIIKHNAGCVNTNKKILPPSDFIYTPENRQRLSNANNPLSKPTVKYTAEYTDEYTPEYVANTPGYVEYW